MNFLFPNPNKKSIKTEFDLVPETPPNTPLEKSETNTEKSPIKLKEASPIKKRVRIPTPPPLPPSCISPVSDSENLIKILEKNEFDDNESDNMYSSSTDKREDILDKVADEIIAQLNSDIYVICKDDEPITYCDSEEKAHEIMWKIARKSKAENIFKNPDYNFYLCTEDYDNEVDIIGTYKNWFLNYENIFVRLNYNKVEKYEEE